jgi:hypothetical protein
MLLVMWDDELFLYICIDNLFINGALSTYKVIIFKNS